VQLHRLVPARRDPWWDLEGTGARRLRTRRAIESALAFGLALAAVSFALAIWITAAIAWLPA